MKYYEKTSSSQIYFLQVQVKDGPIKIGLATNVESRRKSIQANCPWLVTIIGTIEGNYPEETFLHKFLAKYRMHSEWYFANPELLKIINVLLQGEGPIQKRIADMLPEINQV